METPFERLAQVLDNASANYLAAEQRKARLADQRGYDGAVLADVRAYEQTQEAKQREQNFAGYHGLVLTCSFDADQPLLARVCERATLDLKLLGLHLTVASK